MLNKTWLRNGCAIFLLGGAVLISSRIVGKLTGKALGS